MLGKIYKIIHSQSNICYVGSTFNSLKGRFAQHKADYKRNHNISIYKYFEQHGIDNFKMILIKEYEVIDRRHLEVYEQLWINKLRCINKAPVIEFLLKECRKQTLKKYYENNKEKEANRQREFIKKNKERYSATTECECGGHYTYKNKSAHFKSKKHLVYLSSDK